MVDMMVQYRLRNKWGARSMAGITVRAGLVAMLVADWPLHLPIASETDGVAPHPVAAGSRAGGSPTRRNYKCVGNPGHHDPNYNNY